MDDTNNKFLQHDVLDFYLYNNNDELITKIDTIKENEITCTRTGRWLLKLKDALIDKKFFQYIVNNSEFEGRICGKGLIYKVEEYIECKSTIEIPKVKMLYYKIKKDLDSVSEVDILFEILQPINVNVE